MEIQSKRRKLKAKEDRISDLPDEIIQHILSFLPSTKAIQTSILSKRWNKQWIHVTALSFDSFTATSPGNFHKLVKNTMINHHDCSKIKKFYVEYPYLNISPSDSKFDEVIFLATRKHVEELTLSSYSKVPECLFKNASSVVRLTLSSCYIMPMREVNWGRLTELHLKGCRLNGQALEHILSGSPLLESLELNYCSMIDNLVIASKSLKRLVLQHSSDAAPILSMEISCPNLVGLYLTRANLHPNSFAQVIENVLSISLSLKSLELNRIRCTVDLDCLVITSKSLKRLVLNLDGCFGILNIQVSCPQLQMLKLIGILRVRTVELLNLPSSLCATFDFRHSQRDEICNSLVKHILHQLQHVKELTIGSLFIRCLSALEAGDMFPFVLNIKRLILNSPDLIYDGFGVELILRNALTLEKLVINMPHHHQDEFINCEENFWSSNATNFNYLLSHVKSIEIIGFPMTYDKCSFMTNFIEFLLKNAPVLEKMVLILTDLPDIVPSGIYHSLLHLPRCSKHAIIELVNCK